MLSHPAQNWAGVGFREQVHTRQAVADLDALDSAAISLQVDGDQLPGGKPQQQRGGRHPSALAAREIQLKALCPRRSL